MTSPFLFQTLFLSAGFISNMSVHRQYFPDEEDQTGAAKALMRLQDTYQLDSEAFSKGMLPGDQRECGSTKIKPRRHIKEEKK